MAKIAHCVGIGEFGVDNFDPFLPLFIRGQKKIILPLSVEKFELDLAFFVGSAEKTNPPTASTYECSVNLQPLGERGYIIYANVRLFPLIGGTTALVVVGSVSK